MEKVLFLYMECFSLGYGLWKTCSMWGLVSHPSVYDGAGLGFLHIACVIFLTFFLDNGGRQG